MECEYYEVSEILVRVLYLQTISLFVYMYKSACLCVYDEPVSIFTVYVPGDSAWLAVSSSLHVSWGM